MGIRKSYIPYDEYNKDDDCWIFPFDMRVIKTESWIDLPSPSKPNGIQISVVIINWDRPINVVETSISSVLNQDFPPENFEVIFVGDASERIPSKPACINILKEYPNHNFRAYLLDRTRCYQDSHVYNVGFKRALGWIVVMLQSDAIFDDEPERELDESYPKQPVLEGTWRHHNARDKLGLCPRYLWMPKEDEYAHWTTFPHELGLSFRKKYIEAIHGVNEAKYSDAPLNDFRCELTQRFGIVFTEDVNMQVIHRDYILPKNVLGDPEVLRPRPLDHQFPDWPNDWGELNENEERKVIMTDAMKENLR